MAKRTTRLVDIILSVKDKASGNLSRFGTQVGVVKRSLLGLKAIATGALGGYAIARGVQASVREFAEFEKSLANVSTMLKGDVGPTMGRFRDEVLSLSRALGEDKGALTSGLYDILSAGIDAGGAMDVLRTATIAAKAGVSDSAESVKLLVGVMNAYGLASDHAGRISDILFSTVKSGVTTFGELSQYLGQVTSLASTAGVTLEELVAALSTMTRAGVRTDKAVTALQGILTAFIEPTEGAKRAAAELGIELNTETLRSRGLKGVLEDLRGVQLEHVAAIFENVEALRGVAPLLNDYQGYLLDLNSALGSAGATMEAFGKQTDTTANRLALLGQEWRAFLDAVGGRIAGSDVIPAMTGFFAGDPEARLAEQTKELIQHFGEQGVKAGTVNSFIIEAVAKHEAKVRADYAAAGKSILWKSQVFPSGNQLLGTVEAMLRAKGHLRLSEPSGPAPGGEAGPALAPEQNLLELMKRQAQAEAERLDAAQETLGTLKEELHIREAMARSSTEGRLAQIDRDERKTREEAQEALVAQFGGNWQRALLSGDWQAMQGQLQRIFDAERRAAAGDGGTPFAGRQATGMYESRFLKTAPEVRRDDKLVKATETGNKQRAGLLAESRTTNQKLDAITQRLAPSTVMGF